MRSIETLTMIKEGRIEELEQLLKDEIYADALKNKPGASKRYSAMKKYFTYIKTEREILQKPCMIEFNGKTHTSFCNSHSLALTTEPCGSIELYTDVDRYPNVARLITFEGHEEKIDFAKVFAAAKAEGYKLKKSEVDGHKFQYLMRYRSVYFKLGLIDSAFAIIDDGKEATVYIKKHTVAPITIETSIGVCTVMPMRLTDEYVQENNCIVIDVESKGD